MLTPGIAEPGPIHALATIIPQRGLWQDAVIRQFRYVDVLGLDGVTGAGVLPMVDEAIERLGGAGEPAGLSECCQVALLVRDKLAERSLVGRPVTSGSKGLHLYAALPGRRNPDETTSLAKEIAEELQAEHPSLVTATMTKAKRPGKVFLDWSQNAGSKTTVSPYSLRGRERPTVATPVTWDEVAEGADDPLALDQFGFEDVLARVEEHGDLFAE